jgi:hypothetical protein
VKSPGNRGPKSFPKARRKTLSKCLWKRAKNVETGRAVSGLHSILCERRTVFAMNNLAGCAGVPLAGAAAAVSNRLDFHTGNRFGGLHLSLR